MVSELLIVFINGIPKIVVDDPNNYPSPDVVYTFTPVNNDFIANHYSNIGSGYAYNSYNIQGFINAIMADNTLTSAAAVLQSYLTAVWSYPNNPVLAKQIWALLQQQYPDQLTPQIVSTVEGYATANGIPLT